MKPKCDQSLFKQEDFWLDNPSVLYKDNNYLNFFPKYESSRNSQLNAITRLSIYFSLLVLIFGMNHKWLYLPLTLIILIIVFHNIAKFDKLHRFKDFNRIVKQRKETYDKIDADIKNELKHDDTMASNYSIDEDNIEQPQKNYIIESGLIDSNGNINTGEFYGVNKSSCDNCVNYSAKEIDEYKNNTCRKPTVDNPFMNTNITDYNNGHIPEACNADDDDIKENITVTFNDNLFKSVDELWEKENSQRQFYTIPNSTVPNNQVEFAKWLYKIPENCKESNKNGECLRYEDLRYRER